VNQAASITLPAATVNHTIDGNLNESDWKLSTTINHMVSGSTTDTGSWGASWDNNYLYVGVKVNDNNLSTAASFTATNYWQNDSVELYVDPNADKGTTYDANDKQLAAVWNNPGLYGLSGEVTPGVQHAWANVTGGYSIEFAIPWSSLGVTPSNNMKLGLDIGINDSVNNARVGQLMWNGTSNNYQDPSNFGLVTLTGTPAIVQGDLNGDGHVTITDLSMLLTNYGTSNSVADINGDGLVNILDLSILLSNYGK
jgi:hypothetical protein